MAGRTKTASALRDTDVEIDKHSVEQAHHFTNEELPNEENQVQHVFCCVLNSHQDHTLFKQNIKQKDFENDDAENSSDCVIGDSIDNATKDYVPPHDTVSRILIQVK